MKVPVKGANISWANIELLEHMNVIYILLKDQVGRKWIIWLTKVLVDISVIKDKKKYVASIPIKNPMSVGWVCVSLWKDSCINDSN
jgi:hypothetical protein